MLFFTLLVDHDCSREIVDLVVSVWPSICSFLLELLALKWGPNDDHFQSHRHCHTKKRLHSTTIVLNHVRSWPVYVAEWIVQEVSLKVRLPVLNPHTPLLWILVMGSISNLLVAKVLKTIVVEWRCFVVCCRSVFNFRDHPVFGLAPIAEWNAESYLGKLHSPSSKTRIYEERMRICNSVDPDFIFCLEYEFIHPLR